MTSVVDQKRQTFLQEIRQRQKLSSIQKIRYQALNYQRTRILNQLIQETSISIQEKQFQSLLTLINTGDSNALIHMGNLLIDGIINNQMLYYYEATLHFPTSEYTIWLLRVMWEKGFVPSKFETILEENMGSKPSQFCLQNGLLILKQYLRRQPQKIFNIINSRRIMNTVRQGCLTGQKHIKKLGYGLLSAFTFDANNVHELWNTYDMAQISSILSSGLLSVYSSVRALSVQVANNLMVTECRLVPLKIVKLILQIALNQKNNVKTEISYFIQNLLCFDSLDVIELLIKQDRLVLLLSQISKTGNQECFKNVVNGCMHLSNRIKTLNNSFTIEFALRSHRLYFQDDCAMDDN